MKFRLEKSPRPEKKWRAMFIHEDGKETHTDFGATGYQDYTQHHSKQRRKQYILRHKARENWNDPTSAGSLSYHLLWGPSVSLEENVRLFKRKFHFQ